MLAEPKRDPNECSLPAMVAGMAVRFLARQIRNKELALDNSPPMVSFTFDDVPASACEIGASLLERHGARGTFYIAGNGCGSAGSGGPPRATIEQLRAIWANGHEIGCHTFTHQAVRYISLAELGMELDQNQSALKAINGDLVIRNFAYPYGDLSVGSKRYLEARFDSCRSTHAGINSVVADLGALKAWPLDSESLDRTKIAALIAETVLSHGWLIFYSHDVAEQPSKYGVLPDLLEWAIVTAKRSGCVLTTVAEGLKTVKALHRTG